MAKVIDIQKGVTYIGTDDGKMVEVRVDELTFLPRIGMEVDVYQNEVRTLVVKRDPYYRTDTQEEEYAEDEEEYEAYGTPVNKVLYCVLALFFGWAGVHKFYAKKTGAGILYLVLTALTFTLVPRFLSFVEFCITLSKRADADGNIYL